MKLIQAKHLYRTTTRLNKKRTMVVKDRSLKATAVAMYDEEKKQVTLGYAVCLQSDLPNRKEGLRFAMERAQTNEEIVPHSVKPAYIVLINDLHKRKFDEDVDLPELSDYFFTQENVNETKHHLDS